MHAVNRANKVIIKIEKTKKKQTQNVGRINKMR